MSGPFSENSRLQFESFYYSHINRPQKICSMNTLKMCGDILQPGGKLGTPGLVNDGNNYTSKWKTKSTLFYSTFIVQEYSILISLFGGETKKWCLYCRQIIFPKLPQITSNCDDIYLIWIVTSNVTRKQLILKDLIKKALCISP